MMRGGGGGVVMAEVIAHPGGGKLSGDLDKPLSLILFKRLSRQKSVVIQKIITKSAVEGTRVFCL